MLAIARAYWNLIRSAKTWLAITLGLFCIGFVAGLVTGFINPSIIVQMLGHSPPLPNDGFAAFLLILKHNLLVTLFTWLAGFVLAIAPVFMTLGAGFIMGGLLADAWPGEIVPWFLATFPHGIVELPAILLATTFSSRLGLRWLFQKSGSDRKRAFIHDFQDTLKIGLLCILLFTIAAMLESFATPKIMASYSKEHFGRIGVFLGVYGRRLTIDRVILDTPASRAGLVSGLIIQRIDGVEATGKGAGFGNRIRGRVGTKVRLEVIDDLLGTTNTVDLVREELPK